MDEKLFYKIGEVSQITGLESYVLRFWETEFPSLRPRKSKGKQRVYTKKEIDLILRIKHLLYQEGLTIAGAKKRLAQSSKSWLAQQDPRENVIHTVKKGLEEVLHILS